MLSGEMAFSVEYKCVSAGNKSRSGNKSFDYKNAATGESGSARCGIVDVFIYKTRRRLRG